MTQARERKIRPVRKLEDAGHLLMTLVAQSAADARAHLQAQLSLCDGWPARGEQVSVSTSGVSNPTMAQATQRAEIERRIEALDQRERDVPDMVRAFLWANQTDLRFNVPRDVVQPKQDKLCRDGITDTTRKGSLDWHDPTCMATGVKLGLCQRHYDARRYWLTMNGIEDDGEHLPEVIRSTREVLVRDGWSGVVHVAYVRTETA